MIYVTINKEMVQRGTVILRCQDVDSDFFEDVIWFVDGHQLLQKYICVNTDPSLGKVFVKTHRVGLSHLSPFNERVSVHWMAGRRALVLLPVKRLYSAGRSQGKDRSQRVPDPRHRPSALSLRKRKQPVLRDYSSKIVGLPSL